MKRLFEEFVHGVVQALQANPAVVGLAIAGSWITDEVDEYSDLDLVIVCNNDAFRDVTEQKRSIARQLGSLVSAFTGEHVGEPDLLICLYKAPSIIHVDLKFTSLADLAHRSDDPVVAWERDSVVSDLIKSTSASPPVPDIQWIEDRFWTWIHYSALRLGRGEIFDLVGFLGFMREQVLGPLALSHAKRPPHGVRKLERYAPEFSAKLTDTVPSYDLESCYRCILAVIDLYREQRARAAQAGFVENSEAEELSIAYLDKVARTRSLAG